MNTKRDVLEFMEQYLGHGSDKLKDDLYNFGLTTGQLTQSEIMMAWNGVSMSKFPAVKQLAFLEFLSNYAPELRGTEALFGVRPRIESKPLPPFDRKKSFSSTQESSSNLYFNVLKKVSQTVENIFGKDLSELAAEELIAGMSEMKYTNITTLRNDLNIVKRYIKWCYESGYYSPHNNEVQRVTVKDVPIYRAVALKLIKDPAELQQIIYQTREKGGINTDSVILCLYWMGFARSEIHDLKKSDVDVETHTILHPEWGEVPIPEEFRDIVSRYYDTQDVKHLGINYLADESERFLKKYVRNVVELTATPMSIGRIDVLVNSFAKEYARVTCKEQRITGTNLINSGACYRIYSQVSAMDEDERKDALDGLVAKEFRKSSPGQVTTFKKLYDNYAKHFFGE